MYAICLVDGQFGIYHAVRRGGDYTLSILGHEEECGLKDMGKIANISDVASKNVHGGDNGSDYNRYWLKFQPSHGYAVMFTTENGEQKYLRVYAKDYYLENNSFIESITIQYQLY